MARWNPLVFDMHIDPEYSAFTSADVPDPAAYISGSYWMADYFLNATLRSRWTGRWHQLFMGLIWRSQLCLQHYCAARIETLTYVDGHDPSQPKLGTYFRALGEWEAFLLNAMLAIGYINKINGNHTFSPGDGSIDQRVYDVGVHIKHMQDRIAREDVDHDVTMPIILTNDGVKSSSSILVTYAEMFKLLEDLAAIALEAKDPKGMAETRRTKLGID